jgi:hypothetical protein
MRLLGSIIALRPPEPHCGRPLKPARIRLTTARKPSPNLRDEAPEIQPTMGGPSKKPR